MKRFVVLVLWVSFLCVVLGAGSRAINSAPTPEQYVMTQIANIVQKSYSGCQWSSNTAIENKLVLYGWDDSPNGYIYTLITDDNQTGYMQINASDTNYSIHSFSFDGTNEAVKMLENFSLEAETTTLSVSADLSENKIYYGGGSAYAVEYGGQLYNLLLCELITFTKEELSSLYEVQEVTQEISTCSVVTDTGSTMVSNYDDFNLVDMDDFAGMYVYGGHTSIVSNHCTPTAATNVIKYFAEGQGIEELFYGTNWLTFKALYIAMDTNSVNDSEQTRNGTSWSVFHSDGYSGLLDYIEARGVTVSSKDRYAVGAVVSPSIDTLKKHIDADRPIFLSVKSFPGAAGTTAYHSVVMFGYDENMVILSNGWDKSFHYYTYSDLKVHEYYYVDF